MLDGQLYRNRKHDGSCTIAVTRLPSRDGLQRVSDGKRLTTPYFGTPFIVTE